MVLLLPGDTAAVDGCAEGGSSLSVDDLCRRDDILQSSRRFTESTVMTVSETQKILYVKEGEISVHIAESDFDIIGSDDATTCHLVIARLTAALEGGGRCLVAHVDSPRRCASLKVHLESLAGAAMEGELIDIYVSGGLVADDTSTDLSNSILRILCASPVRYRLMLWSTNALNSIELSSHMNQGSEVKYCPRVLGMCLQACIGEIKPCQFPVNARGPDITLRNAVNWAKLLSSEKEAETNDLNVVFGGSSGQFTIDISPLFSCLDRRAAEACAFFLELDSESDLLEFTSSSPHCEPPHFVAENKKAFLLLKCVYAARKILSPASGRAIPQAIRELIVRLVTDHSSLIAAIQSEYEVRNVLFRYAICNDTSGWEIQQPVR